MMLLLKKALLLPGRHHSSSWWLAALLLLLSMARDTETLDPGGGKEKEQLRHGKSRFPKCPWHNGSWLNSKLANFITDEY